MYKPGTKIYAVVLEQFGVPDHRNIYDGLLKYYQLVVMGLCCRLENMVRTWMIH
jgi:hypothetical protein